MSLLEIIQARLATDQMIPFMEFMQLALYAPQYGYYSNTLAKIGRQGDFITAPELSPLFGMTLANQCQQILCTLNRPHLLEFGAGTGALCVSLLQRLDVLDCLPESYFILELSASLRQRQQELIQQKIPHLAHKVHWLSAWPDNKFNGIVIANEVLDAMPVHRFIQDGESILECYVALNEDRQLVECVKPCVNPRLRQYINEHVLPQSVPYQSEVNLFIDGWIQQIYDMIEHGVVFLIDYGFPRHEYYHPERQQGTLMCHYQHQAHTNPLIHLGEQDITAHVDFTHVAEAAVHAGFHVAGYTNQASFLLANGLLSFLNEQDSVQEQFQMKQSIKQLTLPSEMGELFKVMALSKDLDIELHGFLLNDKRVSL